MDPVRLLRLAPSVAAVLALPRAGCSSTTAAADAARFALTSPAFQDGGTLPVVYTCDGAGHSPPLAWTGAPLGTAQFAVLMTTLANDGLKWNWVLYGIPGNVTVLAESTAGVGLSGLTSDGPALAYSPPCSQGPGAKTHSFTVYALSAAPALDAPADSVTGQVLAAAIDHLILSSSRLNVTYTR
jgi:phosphatidylethanolamine-binding protein (PEBP) family uncharacterized protein